MVKSLVNPNFVDLFYIHHASSIPPYNFVEADRGCMVLVSLFGGGRKARRTGREGGKSCQHPSA